MTDRIDTEAIDLPNTSLADHATSGLSANARQILSLAGSYIFLAFGAIFMLFPVFWMLTAALKPTWQVAASDIILPSLWHKASAGDTLRLINLWTVPADGGNGGRADVILYGARRQYLTMLDAEHLGSNLTAIPRDQSGAIDVLQVDEFRFNGLQYNDQDYVLVGADGDNFLVVSLDSLDLNFAMIVPRSQQRSAERSEITSGAFTLPVRVLDLGTGDTVNLIEAGPNIEFATVLPADYAQHLRLVPQAALGDHEIVALGDSEADLYKLDSDDSDERYLVIENSEWRPIIGVDALQTNALTIPKTDFVSDGESITTASGAVFPLGAYHNEPVALILSDLIETSTSPTVLVLPLDKLNDVQMIVSTSLFEPRPIDINGTTVRVKDFDHPSVEEESTDLTRMPHRVAIVGERQNMALVLPASQVAEMRDHLQRDLERKLSFAPQFHNLVRALVRETGTSTFLTFFKNSTIIAVMYIIGHLFSCTVVAYGFARMRAPGRNFLFGILIATLMMPGFITVIPVYRIFRDLNLVDTLWPMFLRGFFGSAFFIFLLRQFFTTIPIELEEAARIDGASRLQTFFRIMLPLITPALATIVIFTFLWSWNDAFNAAIYLNSPQNYTVAIGLKQFLGQYSAEFNLLMAAASVAMLPTVLLFFFAQRYFIEGITLTGMKG